MNETQVALLAYVCLSAILMAMGAKKLNRYMLPVILALDIVAALGTETIFL
jgi:hypothetical protein